MAKWANESLPVWLLRDIIYIRSFYPSGFICLRGRGVDHGDKEGGADFRYQQAES